jgi:hypothetical protein
LVPLAPAKKKKKKNLHHKSIRQPPTRGPIVHGPRVDICRAVHIHIRRNPRQRHRGGVNRPGKDSPEYRSKVVHVEKFEKKKKCELKFEGEKIYSETSHAPERRRESERGGRDARRDPARGAAHDRRADGRLRRDIAEDLGREQPAGIQGFGPGDPAARVRTRDNAVHAAHPGASIGYQPGQGKAFDVKRGLGGASQFIDRKLQKKKLEKKSFKDH